VWGGVWDHSGESARRGSLMEEGGGAGGLLVERDTDKTCFGKGGIKESTSKRTKRKKDRRKKKKQWRGRETATVLKYATSDKKGIGGK